MRPEDITEQDENGKIKDTEGQLAADENRNETVETEVSQETHSEYKIPGKSESRVSYHLSGMYQDWFLDYASYVILERAVPHINDGLKPVQRRILHSMKRLDDGRYNKVANIVGHTMQFHPHGDASIGDALVQLGQKDLLIDCQGNWGNILPHRCRCCGSALYRGAPLQVCAGNGLQSENDSLATFLRRAEQGAGDASRQVPFAAGARCGRYCRRAFFQNIAA